MTAKMSPKPQGVAAAAGGPPSDNPLAAPASASGPPRGSREGARRARPTWGFGRHVWCYSTKHVAQSAGGRGSSAAAQDLAQPGSEPLGILGEPDVPAGEHRGLDARAQRRARSNYGHRAGRSTPRRCRPRSGSGRRAAPRCPAANGWTPASSWRTRTLVRGLLRLGLRRRTSSGTPLRAGRCSPWAMNLRHAPPGHRQDTCQHVLGLLVPARGPPAVLQRRLVRDDRVHQLRVRLREGQRAYCASA